MEDESARLLRKEEIRLRALEARKGQPDKAALSRRICHTLAALPEYREAHRVMFYVNMPSEVDTQHFIPSAWKENKLVIVPYLAHGRIELFGLKSLDELSPGRWKILEPQHGLRGRTERHVDPSEVDLVVVPGVAFDRRGGRVGHGKGYYDALLKHVRPDVPLVGLAFECQVLDQVPMLPHDVWMTRVITERAIYLR